MQESEIDLLLAQARQEGRFDSSGSFTVLLRQAQNHAGKDFARLYPGGYLLKVVQCAVAAGCNDIRIQCRRAQTTVKLLGPGPARIGSSLLKALQNPLEFRSQDPMGHLAVGVLAALAEGASLVEWSCFDGRQGETLTVNQQTVDLKTFNLRPWKGRGETGFALTVHRDAGKMPFELNIVKSRCGYCPVSLTLNGKQLRGTAWQSCQAPTKTNWYKGYAKSGFRLAERYLYREKPVSGNQTIGLPNFELARYGSINCRPVMPGWAPEANKVFLSWDFKSNQVPIGALALPIDMEGKSRVIWVQYGVRLESEFHDFAYPGAIAVLEASQLNTDATGLKVVTDEHHRRAIHFLGEQISELHRHYQKIESKLTACPEVNQTLPRAQIGMGITLGLVSLATGIWAKYALFGAFQLAAGLAQKESPKTAGGRARLFQLMTYGRFARLARTQKANKEK